MSGHLPVDKTFKLFIGGAFPRSESGHTFQVHGADGQFLANAAKASRKDLRETVRAARSAQSGWAGRTAYNRGQVLYRVAEMLDARADEFVDLLRNAGRTPRAARREVEQSVDRWVWYAGWADKVHQVLGTVNPVAGPYFNFTVPEPTGVVVQAVPDDPPLLGLTSRVAPGHLDVNAVDLAGAPDDLPNEALADAAENVKRLVHANPADASPMLVAAFLEFKTVWHPIGR